MVIIFLSIFWTLLILTILCYGFSMINQAINIQHRNNIKKLHKCIWKDVLFLFIMMAILWIGSIFITLKKIGTLLYLYPIISYIIIIAVDILLIFLLQKYWNIVYKELKGNIKHINHSDTIQTLNKWKNKY